MLLSYLKGFISALKHVLREENRIADALANMATTMTHGENATTKVSICHRWFIRGCL